MHPLLEEIYRLQNQMPDLDAKERILLKMFANFLESHYEAKNPRNAFTVEEIHECPGRWEFHDGMLYSD